jgi:hypothetical protein
MTPKKTQERLRKALELLTGQAVPLDGRDLPSHSPKLLSGKGTGLGYSQFNELLLTLGYDRVAPSFFQYLVDGALEYRPGADIRTFEQLESGIDRFRTLALLHYGNVKFGFKKLSGDASALLSVSIGALPEPDDKFQKRHEPVLPIDPIPGADTYYLGYLIERELAQRLKDKPKDRKANAEEAKRQTLVRRGLSNQEAYLCSDHLDVYVATSMRARHEYLTVSTLVQQIFNDPRLGELKLRWFDPTQAYCKDRVDKGLSEALMLRRARCTLYFAQESDTLGKDSELASTLAQGKVVIAYVPEGDGKYVKGLLNQLKEIDPDRDEFEILLEQLQIFDPRAAWENPSVRRWLDNKSTRDIKVATQLLERKVRAHYDNRAKTLKDVHPLGIQVNLTSGVANGVLVVRTVSDCAELIRRAVMRTMEFRITMQSDGDRKYWYLRESISDCIYRVMTGDRLLTNAFWNFYLDSRSNDVQTCA